MAVFAIPNPKKTTQVDFPIERVKLSVLNISLENNKYKFSKSNEIFNQYTYEAFEFLSLGVYIDINLNKITDEKTEITIEIRRKLGTFNQSYEVTRANNHLDKVFNIIANLTIKSPQEIAELNTNKISDDSESRNKLYDEINENEKKSTKSNDWKVIVGLVIVFFVFVIYSTINQKNDNENNEYNSTTESITEPIIEEPTKTKEEILEEEKIAKEQLIQEEKDAAEAQLLEDKENKILERIKRKAERDYPNDYFIQKSIYDQEVESYNYMKSVSDLKIKRKVERDYPNDYFIQKSIYNQEIDAKEQMK